MSAATINTFPPVHTFNSSRSWAMAIIVLLHLGAFWALTTGMAVRLTGGGPTDLVTRLIEEPKKVVDPLRVREPVIDDRRIVIVVDKPPVVPENEDKKDVITGDVVRPEDVIRGDPEVVLRPTPTPVMVEPQVDPRVGLSEPVYPVPEIRMGNEGTVILSLQILENGRVGEVRIERSSGFERLDSSAAREARRWRFRPGTRDGVPVVMWKQLPVTFQLKQ